MAAPTYRPTIGEKGAAAPGAIVARETSLGMTRRHLLHMYVCMYACVYVCMSLITWNMRKGNITNKSELFPRAILRSIGVACSSSFQASRST